MRMRAERIDNRRLLSMLGLALRAGALAVGIDAVRTSLRNREAELVVLAGDASDSQLEKVRALIGHAGVARLNLGSKALLGRALGREVVSAVAVTDPSFAEGFMDKFGSRESRLPQALE